MFDIVPIIKTYLFHCKVLVDYVDLSNTSRVKKDKYFTKKEQLLIKLWPRIEPKFKIQNGKLTWKVL